jgi:hypothetical protein
LASLDGYLPTLVSSHCHPGSRVRGQCFAALSCWSVGLDESLPPCRLDCRWWSLIAEDALSLWLYANND